MDRRRPPQTEEGWYVLHDFRSVDWDAWRNAPERRRARALEEGIDYLSSATSLTDVDAEEGGSAVFSVIGHEADFMVLHLRPTIADLDALERRFEGTALAEFTEHTDSYLSVTEVSGYMSEEYFEEDGEADSGIARYIESRLEPEIPDAEYVSFYPMDKRRDAEWNWYDLSFDERAEYMSGHGDIGRKYAGRVTQIISGSVGLDDHEWGVTLFADDPADIKGLLYEMRFDPSSSRFGEFGRFRFGRRFAPENLRALLSGERVSQEVDEGDGHSHGHGHDHGSSRGHHGHGGDDKSSGHHGDSSGHDHAHGSDDGDDSNVRDELEDLGVYAGKPHGEDVHAVVLYSAADVDDLFEEVQGLRANFDHYDSHVKTAVYDAEGDGGDENEAAVVSLWETERAANTAAGFLGDLPEIVRQAGDEGDSWGTMGMFYAVEPDHRGDFVGTFEEVGDALADMDGHRKTTLLANLEDENDMFIASRWDAREDAMAFFRSDAFAETVEWGRDILTERPRHVFLA
ncbi:heme-binding protein [Natronosalvus rutilus]|uniref:Heme-binding protein n=1 Tax=Natronosalvus rutilus TaxID=2953753 RepID=A0A9E7SWB3_9EURY|nr:heme-binding protein [Natronosalvus rutilus]UTF53876.1 heme-binding protein [Natronosalvus rutilus]